MKKILKGIINNVNKYKYRNVFGEKFRGKTKLCLEVCKHLYMNDNYKKGIFVFELINFNSMKKNIPELNK